MAKQTFTTGQVLTAAQMTSLQQTAMGGGSPVQKTASYVLVADDAGTVIQMNSASSTTITVNTALFAAGDSVQIQNIGTGTCTITAGTATVTTAGSLALTQWEGGSLYFTSTSAAIFFDIVQAGSTSPLTTKGDLYTRTSTADARLAVGTNGYTLVADSSTSTGLAWQAVSAGGLSLINSFTMSGVATASFDSVFSSTYSRYRVVAYFTSGSDGWMEMQLRTGGVTNTTSNYYGSVIKNEAGSATTGVDYAASTWDRILLVGTRTTGLTFDVINPYSSSLPTTITGTYGSQRTASSGTLSGAFGGLFDANTSFDGLRFVGSGNMTGGVKIYGYQE
jgi:hypothetical protein